MRSKLSFVTVLVLAVSILLGSCNSPINPGGDINNPLNPGGGQVVGGLTVNLSGAKALVTKSASNVAQSMGRGFSPRAITDSPLVKILENGTLENVLQTDGTASLPDIDFLALSPTGDVFVYFKYSFQLKTGDNYQSLQFIKLTSDNKIEIVEGNCYINKFQGYGGGAGANQKPVVFNDDGSIFYAMWDGDGPVLKRYAAGVATAVTKKIANVQIEAFFTDGTNLYYVGRNNTETNRAYYMRMVKQDGTFKDVFYKADGNGLWIRAVKRSGTDILVHGWGIPDADLDKPNLSYNGLVRISKDAADNFTSTMVVGYSNDTNNSGTGGNFSVNKLSTTVFADAAGKLDTTLLKSIIRPFFVDGLVPDGIDFTKTITIDRNSTEFITDFFNNDERYFWYLLLKDSAGFDVAVLKAKDSNGNFPSLFGANVESTILYSMFEQTWQSLRNIPSTDAMMNADGTVDSAKFFTRFMESANLKKYFATIAMKPGAVVPRSISNTYNTADQVLAGKKFIDAVFDYTPALQAINYPSTYYFLTSNSYYWITGTSAAGCNPLDGTWDNAAYLSYIKGLITNNGATPSYVDNATFAPKTNGAAQYNPATSKISAEESYYPIAWEFEENDTSKTYDRVGLLGRFRVVATDYNTRNFLLNFYKGLNKVPGPLVVYSGTGTVEQLFNTTTLISGMQSATSAQFLNFTKQRTNTATLSYKDLGSGTTIWDKRALTFTTAERDQEVVYVPTDTYSGPTPIDVTWYTRNGENAYWGASVIMGCYFKVPNYTTTSVGYGFIKNFFDYSTVSSYPVASYAYPSFSSGYYYVAQKTSPNNPAISMATAAEFLQVLKTQLNVTGIAAKVNGAVTFDPTTSFLSESEVRLPVAWEFEENDINQLYDKKGVLGNYRNTSTTWDDTAWVKNFYKDIVPKTYDLTSTDSTNTALSGFFSTLSSDYANYVDISIYKESSNETMWTWRPSYINANGSINTDAVVSFLKRYCPAPAISISNPSGYSQKPYEVIMANSAGAIDQAATQKALINAIFSISGLPTYPAAMSNGGLWQYAPDTRWGTTVTDGLDFNNLETFSLDSKGQIFGLFKKDWSGSIYNLAKLWDSTTNVAVKEVIKKDMTAAALQVKNDALYYAITRGSIWSLKRFMLDGLGAEQDLIPEVESMELYKYNVADSAALSRVFFTGSHTVTGKLMVGFVDLKNSNKITYQESAGLSATSEIEVFSGN